MRVTKSIIPLILLSILVFTAIEPASAGLTVAFNQTTAHVGDTITIMVTATNDGSSTWHPLKIYISIPQGLQYMSHIVPNRVLQNYDPSTGIWDVNRMSYYGEGQFKQLWITVKVLPEAAGKSLTATARFQTLVIEETGQDITSQQAPARSATVTAESYFAPRASFTANTTSGLAPLAVQFTDQSTGNITGWLWNFGDGTTSNLQNPTHTYQKAGNYTVRLTVSNSDGKDTTTKTKYITVNSEPGIGLGTNPSTGPGIADSNGNGTAIINALKNLTASGNNPLQNLQKGGGGGNEKANEVNITNPPAQDNSLGMYILATLLIAGLLVTGYFYGIRREE